MPAPLPVRPPGAPLKTKRRPRRNVEEILEHQEHVRQEEERKHWQACGRQITSARPSRPGWSIGFRHSQVQVKDRTVWDSPELSKMWYNKPPSHPGPGDFDPPRPSEKASRLMILRGWGSEQRGLMNRDSSDEASSAYRGDLLETHASYAVAAGADSAGFPPNVRAEVVKIASGDFGATDTTAGALDGGQSTAEPAVDPVMPSAAASTGTPSPARIRRARWRGAERRSGTFGSSSLGFRFKPGTEFSRQAPCRTTQRLNNFRDLRDQISDSELICRHRCETTAYGITGKPKKLP